MHLVGEYVVGERVLAEGDEENLLPSIVIVGDAIESDGDEVLDVNDRQGLGVNGGVFGFKGVEGGLAFSRGLSSGGFGGPALAFCLGSRLGLATLFLGLSHGREGRR
jgi:hypothetical protein